MFADEFERGVRERFAEAIDGAEAGVCFDPVDASAGGLDDLPHRRRHFRPDSIAGDRHHGGHRDSYHVAARPPSLAGVWLMGQVNERTTKGKARPPLPW